MNVNTPKGITEKEVDEIRQRLIKQGAVIPPNGTPLADVIWNLFLKTAFAIPGMGVYYGSTEGVYRLEFDPFYVKYSADDFKVGLSAIDSRIEYIRHWQQSDRTCIEVRINEVTK